MRDVVIIGVGMTPFGKFMDKSLNDLGLAAIWAAITDANIPGKTIQAAYCSNCLAGLITGQEGIRGQVILNNAGFCGIPIVNVENACASGATALRMAWMDVALGLHDIVMAVGTEKMYLDDTPRSIKALTGLADIDLAHTGFQFTASFAFFLRKYMQKYGATPEHFAKVVEKNSYNGSLNPYAQHRKPQTVQAVLQSRMVSDPLTLYMCSSMGDGSAATIVCSKEVAGRYADKPFIHIAALALRSGMIRSPELEEVPSIRALTAREAYEFAGIGPQDIDVAEVHDAMAPAELVCYEELGFCNPGEGIRMIEEGRTKISGDMPVNTGGGLTARGHPVGATGLAQVAELVWQLRGRAGARQVAEARVGLAEDSGGWLGEDNAACTVTILKK